MGRFTVRLEDPNSEEFRIVNLSAESAEEAKAACERKEAELVAVRLSDEELAVEQERSAQRDRPTGRLVAHEQQVPYEVVSVEERGARVSERKQQGDGGDDLSR